MSEDSISRCKAIKTIGRWLECKDYNEAERHIMRATQSMLCDLPSVTPKQRTGHWIQKPKHEVTEWNGLDDFTKVVICSECHEWEDHKSRYCPSCGAKMVDPQESEVSDADSN